MFPALSDAQLQLLGARRVERDSERRAELRHLGASAPTQTTLPWLSPEQLHRRASSAHDGSARGVEGSATGDAETAPATAARMMRMLEVHFILIL